MTALACTFQAATALLPPRVLLNVTAAPSLPASYIQTNFPGPDGWTATGGTIAPTSSPTYLVLQGTAAAMDAVRTVTGLVIGQQYKYVVTVRGTHGTINQGVTGMSPGPVIKPADGVLTTMTYTFTATATSHVIRLEMDQSAGSGAFPLYDLVTVSVKTTNAWQGTTITRTDVNGTDVVVREGPGGQDTAGTSGSATMTVTDYESALVGLVTYKVTDGVGGTATANLTPPAGQLPTIALPATSNPATPLPPTFLALELVTRYRENSESNGTVHKIVARADPIANPGPLAFRSGSVDLWCSDYATALAVRKMLAGGAIAHLRQGGFPGLDLYLYATDVSLSPEDTQPTVRWAVSITYQEVAAP